MTRAYYTILGVSENATAAEIKRAFHQKALESHPDKAAAGNKEEATKKFQAVNQAYSVLSDPEKRAVYDRFGENGLAFPGASELGSVLGSQLIGGCFMFVLLLLTILIIIWLSFLCVRVEYRVTWNWTSVWIPLYIFDILVGIPLLIGAGSGIIKLLCFPSKGPKRTVDGEEEILPEAFRPDENLVQFLTVCRSLSMLSYLVFTVTISAGLQRHMDGHDVNWYHYFIPAFIAEFLLMIVFLLSSRESTKALGLYAGTGAEKIMTAINIVGFFNICARAALLVLIAAKVEMDVTSSWWVVFIPAYATAAFGVMEAVLNDALAAKMSLASGEPRKSNCCAAFAGAVFGIGLVYASVFMIIAKLQGRDIPLDHCLIPVFLIIAFSFLVYLCGCIYCCVGARATAHDMRDMENGTADEEFQTRATAETAPTGTAAAPTARTNEPTEEGAPEVPAAFADNKPTADDIDE